MQKSRQGAGGKIDKPQEPNIKSPLDIYMSWEE